jgi:calcineurin-like phosphoesterase family protein
MKTRKINTKQYGNIWFTSDWHLGHDKEFLYGPRGCTSRDGHVEWLIANINELAKPNDLIIHMGDMCLTATMDEYVKFLLQINCKTILSLEGNHDHRFEKLIDTLQRGCIDPGLNLSDDMKQLNAEKTLRSLGPFAEIEMIEEVGKGKKAHRKGVTLCHYPMCIWNKSHHGTYQLCGHSHGSFKESNPGYPEAKRLDVGIENALSWSEFQRVMFDWNDVKSIMKSKTVPVFDHHTKETT